MSERDLWQEVLLRAIMDARLEPSCWPIPARYLDETAEARTYLTTPSKDLAQVCAMAGVDADALVERMQRKVATVPPICGPSAPKPRQKRRQTYTHAGQTLTVPQWAKVTGLSQPTIYGRLRRDWPMDEVLRAA